MAKTRRDFIKISSLSTAGIFVGAKYLQSAIPGNVTQLGTLVH